MMKKFPLFFAFVLLLVVCFTASAQKTDFEQFSRRPSSESEQMTETPETELPEMMPGNTLLFGRYEQDGNRNNGKEPIEWLILSVDDGQALVTSLKMLEVKQYHKEQAEVTWEDSSLREWLNEDFYKNAFTEEEQDQILSVTIHTPDNPKFGTSGGNDTQDQIFLLSIDEAESLFSTGKSRAGEMTVWTKNNSDKVKASESWWLRSSGEDPRYAAYVYKSGEAAPAGNQVSVYAKVRPAFFLNISDLKGLSGLIGTPAPTPTPTPTPLPTVISLSGAKALGLEIPTPAGKEVLYLGEAETKNAERILAVFTKNPEKSTMRNLKVFIYKANFQSGGVKVSGVTITISSNGVVGIKNGKAESGGIKFSNFEFTDAGAAADLTCTVALQTQVGAINYTFKNLKMNFVKITEP